MSETINYYNQNAEAFIAGTINVNMSDIQSRFLQEIPSGALILDLGCGSGRDSKLFSELGYRVTAVDGSPELCKRAEVITGSPVRCLMFEDLDYHEEFDAIWACASLLHVEKNQMGHILQLVSTALKPGGILYVSYKYGNTERESDGRIFSDYTEADIPMLFNRNNQLLCYYWWVTIDARPDRSSEKWINILCKKTFLNKP